MASDTRVAVLSSEQVRDALGREFLVEHQTYDVAERIDTWFPEGHYLRVQPAIHEDYWCAWPLNRLGYTVENSTGQRPGHGYQKMASREVVMQRLNDQARLDQLDEALPNEGLPRAAYETLCAELSVAAMSDAECDNYGVIYGEFGLSEYPVKHIIQIKLARARRSAILAERAMQPKPTRLAPVEVLADCGHYVSPALLMNASIGTSCPECYDDSEAR